MFQVPSLDELLEPMLCKRNGSKMKGWGNNRHLVEGAVCVQKKGITFVCQELSKQDRVGHYISKIFVPVFSVFIRPNKGFIFLVEETDLLRVKSDGTREK